jgi:hypothetical protein
MSSSDESGLTPKETEVMDNLVNAWNSYVSLPIEHPDDTSEFRHAFHSLQHMILMRPTRRRILPDRCPDCGEGQLTEAVGGIECNYCEYWEST